MTDGLLDRFGRRATDLCVSLTDRCNLRCTYCRPAEGLDWLARDAVLTVAEVAFPIPLPGPCAGDEPRHLQAVTP